MWRLDWTARYRTLSTIWSVFSDEVARLRERGHSVSCTLLMFSSGKRRFEIRNGPEETDGIANSSINDSAHYDFPKLLFTNMCTMDVAVIVVEASVLNDLGLSKAQRDANRLLLKGQHNYYHLPEDKLAATRRHASLFYALGFRQIIVVINKMDEVKYSQACFEALKAHTTELLISVGYSRKYVCSAVPFIPISALDGVNVASLQFRSAKLPPSCTDEVNDRIENAALAEMKWWKGATLVLPSREVRTVWNLADALENCPIARTESASCTPQRLRLAPSIALTPLSTNSESTCPNNNSLTTTSAELLPTTLVPPESFVHCCEYSSQGLRAFITGAYRVKGVGIVLTGIIVQGAVRVGDEVAFLPTNTREHPCCGRVLSMERHQKRIACALPGSHHIGIHMEGLSSERMPKTGDLMIRKNDSVPPRSSRLFLALVTVLESDENKKTAFTFSVQDAFPKSADMNGDTLVQLLGGRRMRARLKSFNWRRGPSTGYMKCPINDELHAGDEAEVEIELLEPLMLETFDKCETMGLFAFQYRSRTCMIGRVLNVVPLTEEEELVFAKLRAPKPRLFPVKDVPRPNGTQSNTARAITINKNKKKSV